MQWLYPKVHNTEVLEAQLTNKEFTAFSNANRINSMIQLQRNAQEEFYYLVSNYDFMKQKKEWQEDGN
jgi:spore germination protein YaaH